VVQTNEIANIKLNSPVDDSIFVLPLGTKIMEQPAGTASGQQSGNASPSPDDSAAPEPTPDASPSPSGQ
jgi:hypothetical protein